MIASLDSLDNLFADYLDTILSNVQVLISFPQDGQTGFKITDNIVFVHTEIEDSNVDMYKNRREVYQSLTDNIDITQYSMRELKLRLVFYGNNSDTNAMLVRENMYLDSTQQFLYKNDLSLISNAIAVTKTHEKINEHWWDRVDVEIGLYNGMSIEENVRTILSADIRLL